MSDEEFFSKSFFGDETADNEESQGLRTPRDAPAESLDSVGVLEQPVASAATEDLPEIWDRYGGRVQLDEESSGFAFIAILTIPDERLCDPPSSVASADEVEADLTGFENKSGAEIKKLIQSSLPDAQLATLQKHEEGLESPRKVVLDRLRIELERRGPAICEACGRTLMSYDAWAEAAAADPLTARIIAVAVAVGGGQPEAFVVSRDGDEIDALAFLYEKRESRPPAMFNVLGGWEIVRARAIHLDVPRPTEPPFPIVSRFPDRDVNQVAKAYGLGSAPYVPAVATVQHYFREHAYRRLEQLVRDQLETERMVVLAERTVS